MGKVGLCTPTESRIESTHSNELDINKHDASKSWKLLKNIIGKQGGNYSQKKTFSIDNEIIDNSERIANEFNNFFVSIGHNLANNITCNVNPLFYVNSVNDSVVVQHVSVAQVRNVITSLKDSNPGWDHLSPFVMKQCVDTYVEPITVLINNSFYHGIFPGELKLARVVPIFKSGDSSNINNYRPISILQKYMND